MYCVKSSEVVYAFTQAAPHCHTRPSHISLPLKHPTVASHPKLLHPLRLRSRLVLATRSARVHVCKCMLHVAISNDTKCKSPRAVRMQDHVLWVPRSVFLC